MAAWQNAGITPFVPLIPLDVELVLVLHATDGQRRLGTLRWSHQARAELLSLYGEKKDNIRISWQDAPLTPPLQLIGKEKMALVVMPSTLQSLSHKGQKLLLEGLWDSLGDDDTLLAAIHQPSRWSLQARSMAKWASQRNSAASTWHWAGFADPGNIELIRVQKDTQLLELHALAKQTGYRFMIGRRLLAFFGLYGWLQEHYLMVVPRS